jgi:hypothetical protein
LNSCEPKSPRKGLKMEGLGNGLILSILKPKRTKSISTADGNEVEIHIPDFGIYHVDEETARDDAQIEAWAKECTQSEAESWKDDCRGGYTEVHAIAGKYFGYEMGLVIGENPDARMPEYDTADSHLPMERRRVVRWSRPAEMPEFGDVVLFRQNLATDYSAFWRHACDTTPSCEFALSSRDKTRWLLVPRNAEVVMVPISEVWNVIKRFGAQPTTV